MEERHPIPQNVTGFQFKLIGDMTVKQFAYLAGNVVVAYLFYLLPILAILKWPFILFFVILGIVLAFVPYQGRPVERWIINFFKAVFATNQYVFKMMQKQQPTPQSPPPPVPQKATIEKPQGVLPAAKFISVQATGMASPPTPTAPPPPQPTHIPETPLIKVDKQTTEEPKIQSPELPATKELLEEEFQKLIIRKGQIEKELTRIKTTPVRKPRQFVPPGQQVRALPKELASSVGIPNIPQAPNLISGIIKDTRNNVIPNILVEVKDKEGNLVRAFKTNKLGQFSAATTLENGTYTIELEDPGNQFKFDVVPLTLTGKVVLPLEIRNLEQREELRRRLFSQ